MGVSVDEYNIQVNFEGMSRGDAFVLRTTANSEPCDEVDGPLRPIAIDIFQ
jgi:hypothetical protein